MQRIFAKGYTYGWGSRAGEFQTEEAVESLTRLKEDGVDYLCLAFGAVQETFSSTNIYYEYGVIPTDEDLIFIIQKAHGMGMKVCLKPAVNCKDHTWRAHITFPPEGGHWEKWFRSYTRFMLHYARLAEKYGCEMLCTGCEMNSMNRQSALCREMIAEVRKVYHGLIMHNVNHDSEMEADWLDAVDIVGISAYYRVSTPEAHDRAAMACGWQKAKRIGEAVYRRYGRPVMYAEIGVRSEQGCSEYPWDATNRPEKPVDLTEQADFYDTAMEAMWDVEWFSGFFWWDWPARLYPREKGKENKWFCAYGKPAEDVLRKWYAREAK